MAEEWIPRRREPLSNAKARALDYLAQRDRDLVHLEPLGQAAVVFYGFDPRSWNIFSIGVDGPPYVLRGHECIAVHCVTGEVRYLGVFGE